MGAGLLSEEGAEGSNKIFRHDRAFHARQSSVELNLLDVFTRYVIFQYFFPMFNHF